MGEIQPGNSEEWFVQLFASNERHLRAFVRSMGLGWAEVDDVIQTVSLVMWRKWDAFDPDSDFLAWGRVIARFEVLKARRRMARDRHVFREDLMDLLAEASVEDLERHPEEAFHEALQKCLEDLPERSRKLITTAYREESGTIRGLAERMGKSATSLYKSLDRIRRKLQECITARLHLAGEVGS